MSFVLTPEQQILVDATRDFVAGEIAPLVAEDDQAERFRKEMIPRLGAMGLTGIPTPEVWGGLGLGYSEYALVLEEVARVSPAYAVAIAVTGLPQIILTHFGSEDQKNRYLPRLAQGELLGAFCLSEPGSGSDAASLKTVAVRRGERYVLSGSKMWITHGPHADLLVVMARTGGPGPRGISAFLVEGGTPGLSFGKAEEKMGLRSSPTHAMTLDEVEVPVENRLGEEGMGFTVAMSALDSGRITIAATAVGLCRAALQEAAAYARTREQFGKPIIEHQGVGFLLADMAIATDSAGLLVQRAAWRKDQGMPFATEAAMAKCAATDAAMKVTTDAVQVLGGYGYTREYPVERMMRDAKVMQIVEGTNQVQRVVIARHLARS